MFLLQGLQFSGHQIMKKLSKVFVKKFLSLFFIFSFSLSLSALEATFEGKSIVLNLTVANTESLRRKGLMHVGKLDKNNGMIFIWPKSAQHCMWMKNTPLPLSIAYLSKDGSILEIYDMVPLSEKSVCSLKKARMAVEVNQGWFKTNQITVGDKINF